MSLKSAGQGAALAGISTTGFVDNSGTPGNTTINASRGRAAIALGATACIVTCSACVGTNSAVFIQRRNTDTTAVQLQAVTAAGSFTVTANAATTAAVTFDFLVVN
jgi:hypothetical protein